jgi:hypothetical protein
MAEISSIFTCEIFKDGPIRIEVGKAVTNQLAFQHLEGISCLVLTPLPEIQPVAERHGNAMDQDHRH